MCPQLKYFKPWHDWATSAPLRLCGNSSNYFYAISISPHLLFHHQKNIAMKIKIISAFAVLFFALFSCNRKNDSLKKAQSITLERPVSSTLQEKKDNAEKVDNAPDTAKYSPPQITNEKQKPPSDKKNATIDWDKKIIKTGELNFELKDYAAFNTSIRDKIKQVGGYIAGEEQNQSEYKIENSMTIKVPVDQFDNAVSLLSAGVQKINTKKISSQDVTTEVVDTKSRLEAKKQIRLRYLDFLKQAKNMEEILNVQSEINGIQEEIESATGRVDYLNHSSSFSTISLTYYQVLNSSAENTGKPSFGNKITEAFKTGWSWVSDLFIGVISVWPLFLLVFTALILYKRLRSGKTKAA
jgi:Domain of unknown function (DUF4349)